MPARVRAAAGGTRAGLVRAARRTPVRPVVAPGRRWDRAGMAVHPPAAHPIVVRVLLSIATVLAVFAIFAVWANRQALDADNWADTSTAVLQQPEVKTQVAAFLVDELYANVDVTSEIRTALPPRLQPLAGPAAGGLRTLSTRVTENLLGRPRVEDAWKAANQVTAQQFINVAEGKSSAITAQGNAVVLDLRVLVLDLVQRLGLPGKLASKVPPTAGKIKILDSDQVSTLQNAVSAVRGLSLVLPILALGMLAAAVALARGRRRTILMWAGIDLIIAGAVVLVARNLMGTYVVNALASDAVKPAAQEAWSTGTGMLRDTAQATIIGGIPLVLAAWLAGPARPAVEARRRLAPALRDHQGAAYLALGAILLLIVAWGPIPATRKVLPVLIMAALSALGLRELRRQTLEEFPAAPPPEEVPVPPRDGARPGTAARSG
ncbi:MAG TPA: hypothetical protein VFT50_07335 [Baekduia sp.]|nr:hypothetical protein [Baekduia sp.]